MAHHGGNVVPVFLEVRLEGEGRISSKSGGGYLITMEKETIVRESLKVHTGIYVEIPTECGGILSPSTEIVEAELGFSSCISDENEIILFLYNYAIESKEISAGLPIAYLTVVRTFSPDIRIKA